MANDNSRDPEADRADLLLLEHPPQDRGQVERYIRIAFQRAYGARLTRLMPRLFTLQAPGRGILAGFGLREAAAGPLYLETYLDEPVEEVIGRQANRTVARSSIVEVGNLAATPGGARAMIVALTNHLHQAGFEWVTFTGVAALRAAFFNLGLCPFVIAAADPDRLPPGDLALWGDYFVARPMVMGGHVASGQRSLASRRRSADLPRQFPESSNFAQRVLP
jgi:hypothetical protein